MATTTTSKQFRLNLSDGLKGFIMAVGTPVLYVLQELIPGWDVGPMIKAAIAATVTYLLKNFFDKPKVIVTGLKNDTIDGVKDGTIDVKLQTK